MKTYTAPQLLDKINAYLEQMPYMRPPKGLYEPIAYELSLGGKRIRPVLMLMAYNIYTHPDLPKLKAQLKELEVVRKQKLQIIRMLRGLSDHEWVVSLLNKYIADKDENVQYDAKKALEQTRANAVHANQMREAYKQRNKN